MTPVQMKLFMNDVERVLHAPGNLPGGKLTEMAVVLDYKLPLEQLAGTSRDIVSALKKKGDLFQNVRLNVVKWITDEQIVTEMLPLSMLGIGRGLEDYGNMSHTEDKALEVLAGQLKLFHARSRLVILVSDGQWQVNQRDAWESNLQPFLHKKWIWVDGNGNSKGRVTFAFDRE